MSMPGDISQESTSEVASEPTGNEQPTVETQDHSPTGEQEANPFWGEVEKLTGPNVYKLIQPHLAKADEAARSRVTSVNQSYAPWKELADRGITPQHVQQALGVVQQLNTQPEAVFESLRSFLEREGRLPSNAELKQEVQENEEDGEPDPRDSQIQSLQEQQRMVMQFLQAQHQQEIQAQVNAEADSWLSSELDRVKQAHPDLDQDDIKEVVRIAAFQAQQGQAPNLDQAVAQFASMRDRIRTTPRPGQFAPRLPSGPGGTPSGQAVDPTNMTREQRRELVANMLGKK